MLKKAISTTYGTITTESTTTSYLLWTIFYVFLKFILLFFKAACDLNRTLTLKITDQWSTNNENGNGFINRVFCLPFNCVTGGEKDPVMRVTSVPAGVGKRGVRRGAVKKKKSSRIF